jgi:hypothetical protein
MSKKHLVGSLSALALVALPVAAAADSHGNGNSQGQDRPGKSRKCVPHPVSYRVSGKLVSSSLTVTGSGGRKTASGPITITVTSVNDAAKKAGVTKGSTQSYTLSGAKVTYSRRVTQPNPAAGTFTVVKGTITVVSKKCTSNNGAGTTMIKRVTFTPPRHKS